MSSFNVSFDSVKFDTFNEYCKEHNLSAESVLQYIVENGKSENLIGKLSVGKTFKEESFSRDVLVDLLTKELIKEGFEVFPVVWKWRRYLLAKSGTVNYIISVYCCNPSSRKTGTVFKVNYNEENVEEYLKVKGVTAKKLVCLLLCRGIRDSAFVLLESSVFKREECKDFAKIVKVSKNSSSYLSEDFLSINISSITRKYLIEESSKTISKGFYNRVSKEIGGIEV